MLEIIFFVLSIVVFIKLLKFTFKVTWGITKFVFMLLFWPLVFAAFAAGLMLLAIPVLLVIGICTSVISV